MRRGGNTGTGGRAESGYFPATIETARIVNVNIVDWTVDAVSEYGNRRFFDIQVMAPYLHYFNGEGIYVVPEVGAICYVAQSSSGLMAPFFVLGFQAPPDERIEEGSNLQTGNFRANRQVMNPGDIVLRTRDENFVMLRRGGVVQIGATPTSQRLFIPIGNVIKDMCESYNLFSLAGEMLWEVDRTDQSDAGDVMTRVNLRVKSTAGDPLHSVLLTLGSQTDNPNVRLVLEVKESGAQDAETVVRMTMDNAGAIAWEAQSFALHTTGPISLLADQGNVRLETGDGRASLVGTTGAIVRAGNGNLSLTGNADVELIGGRNATMKLRAKIADIEADTALGGPNAKEPMVLGQALVEFMTEMIQGFTDPSRAYGVAPPPGNPLVFPGMQSLLGKLHSILSSHHRLS
jgi:hypothetical protein